MLLFSIILALRHVLERFGSRRMVSTSKASPVMAYGKE
jgi:hypothetical protein